jgi:hypothetical protein
LGASGRQLQEPTIPPSPRRDRRGRTRNQPNTTTIEEIDSLHIQHNDDPSALDHNVRVVENDIVNECGEHAMAHRAAATIQHAATAGAAEAAYQREREAAVDGSQYKDAIRAAISELRGQGARAPTDCHRTRYAHEATSYRLGEDYQYVVCYLDTGCQIQLAECSWERYMSGATASRASISGFAGKACVKRGSQHGDVYVKFISEWDDLVGSCMRTSIDTLPGLASNLYSVNEWMGGEHDNVSCDIFISSKGVSWVRMQSGDRLAVAPVRFCPVKRHWLMHAIVAGDAETANTVGRCVQRHIRADTFNVELNSKVARRTIAINARKGTQNGGGGGPAQLPLTAFEGVTNEHGGMSYDIRKAYVSGQAGCEEPEVQVLMVAHAVHEADIEAVEAAPRLKFHLHGADDAGGDATQPTPCGEPGCRDGWECEDAVCECEGGEMPNPHCNNREWSNGREGCGVPEPQTEIGAAEYKPRRTIAGHKGTNAAMYAKAKYKQGVDDPCAHHHKSAWTEKQDLRAAANGKAAHYGKQHAEWLWALCTPLWDGTPFMEKWRDKMVKRSLTAHDLESGSPFLQAYSQRIWEEDNTNLSGEWGAECNDHVGHILATLPQPEQYVGWHVEAQDEQELKGEGRACAHRPSQHGGCIIDYRPEMEAARRPGRPARARWIIRHTNGDSRQMGVRELLRAVIIPGAKRRGAWVPSCGTSWTLDPREGGGILASKWERPHISCSGCEKMRWPTPGTWDETHGGEYLCTRCQRAEALSAEGIADAEDVRPCRQCLVVYDTTPGEREAEELEILGRSSEISRAVSLTAGLCSECRANNTGMNIIKVEPTQCGELVRTVVVTAACTRGAEPEQQHADALDAREARTTAQHHVAQGEAMVPMQGDYPRPRGGSQFPAQRAHTWTKGWTDRLPHYLTQRGDTVTVAMRAMGVPVHLHKVLWQWWGEGYGAGAREFDEPWCGKCMENVYFKMPWDMNTPEHAEMPETEQTVLIEGTRLPRPYGRGAGNFDEGSGRDWEIMKCEAEECERATHRGSVIDYETDDDSDGDERREMSEEPRPPVPDSLQIPGCRGDAHGMGSCRRNGPGMGPGYGNQKSVAGPRSKWGYTHDPPNLPTSRLHEDHDYRANRSDAEEQNGAGGTRRDMARAKQKRMDAMANEADDTPTDGRAERVARRAAQKEAGEGARDASVPKTAQPDGDDLPPIDKRIGKPEQHIGVIFYKHFTDDDCTYAGRVTGYDAESQLWQVIYDQTRPNASPPDGVEEDLDQADILKLIINGADVPPAAEPSTVTVEMPEEDLGVPEPYDEANADPSAVRGAKAGMHAREKRQTLIELHNRHGHIGYVPGCEICKLFQGKLRNLPTKVDPHRELRVGYRWHCDTITWNKRNRHGEKYTCAMICETSGFIEHFNCTTRDELPEGVEGMIKRLRANPDFKGHAYELVSELRLDLEGAWSDKATHFNGLMDALGVKRVYACPQDKRSNSRAEKLMHLLEVTVKSTMAQTSMQPEWWGEALKFAILMRVSYPLTRKMNSTDGDCIRPWEELSTVPGMSARVSRRQIDRCLHHAVGFGQLALVANGSVKGSTITKSKARYGICIGMLGDMPTWLCPFTTRTFHSKQYAEVRMTLGVSAMRMLGLDEAPMTKIAMPRLCEKLQPNVKYCMKIENFGEMVGDNLPHMLEYDGVTRFRGMKKALCEVQDLQGNVWKPDVHGDLYLQKLRAAMDRHNPTHENRLPVALMKDKLTSDPAWYVRNALLFYEKRPRALGDGFELRLGRIHAYSMVTKRWSVRYDTVDPAGLAAVPDDSKATLDEDGMQLYVVEQGDSPTPAEDQEAATVSYSTRRVLYAHATCDRACEARRQGSEARTEHREATCAGPCAETENDYHCMLAGGRVRTRRLPTADQFPDQREVVWDVNWAASGQYYTVKQDDTAPIALRAMGVPPKLQKCAFQWLGGDFGPDATYNSGQTGSQVYFAMPWSSRGKKPLLAGHEQTRLRVGAKIPVPRGAEWEIMKREASLVKTERDEDHANTDLARVALHVVEREHRAKVGGTGYTRPAPAVGRDNPDHEEQWPAETYGHEALREYLGKDGRITGCKGMTEAHERKDCKRWVAADEKERSAFTRLKVIDWGKIGGGYIMSELRAKNIHSSPIPWAITLSVKYEPSGLLAKYKSRRYLSGHGQNAKYGEHYTETFSASPSPATTRLIQAICVLMGLKRQCLDICTAYLHTECLEAERCPIRRPRGERTMRKVRQRDGSYKLEEEMGIMMKYIYGMPNSDRRYSQMLNRWLLATFSKKGWTIKQCDKDPCLFVLQYPRAQYTDGGSKDDGATACGVQARNMRQGGAARREQMEQGRQGEHNVMAVHNVMDSIATSSLVGRLPVDRAVRTAREARHDAVLTTTVGTDIEVHGRGAAAPAGADTLCGGGIDGGVPSTAAHAMQAAARDHDAGNPVDSGSGGSHGGGGGGGELPAAVGGGGRNGNVGRNRGDRGGGGAIGSLVGAQSGIGGGLDGGVDSGNIDAGAGAGAEIHNHVDVQAVNGHKDGVGSAAGRLGGGGGHLLKGGDAYVETGGIGNQRLGVNGRHHSDVADSLTGKDGGAAGIRTEGRQEVRRVGDTAARVERGVRKVSMLRVSGALNFEAGAEGVIVVSDEALVADSDGAAHDQKGSDARVIGEEGPVAEDLVAVQTATVKQACVGMIQGGHRCALVTHDAQPVAVETIKPEAVRPGKGMSRGPDRGQGHHEDRKDREACNASEPAEMPAHAEDRTSSAETSSKKNCKKRDKTKPQLREQEELQAMEAVLADPERGTVYMVIHTDDVDLAARDKAAMEYIFKLFDARFGADAGDPTMMLGIERTMSPNGESMELTQTGFVDAMYAEYGGFGPGKTRSTPLRAGTYISRVPKESVNAEQLAQMEAVGRQVTTRGYRGLVGSLLWLARCTMPELLACVSMLSKVMCRPTEEAWEAGIYCVEYCRGQRHRGIKFIRDGNKAPIGYYDSSNRADPFTGKAQHGHALFLADGPVLAQSSIHKHVGMSAAHNEYMALRFMCMDIVWVRELLTEMGLGWMVREPTPANGDNDTAIRFSYEQMLTPGNKYFLQEYYYVREMVRERQVSPRRVGTKGNYADPLTKMTAKGVFEATRPGLTGYLEHGLPRPAPAPPDVDTWR